MATVLQRRNDRARRRGWTSYGQQRYWLARFGADEAGTASRLADRICQGEHEESRAGSYFCRACDLAVNGDGARYAPDGTRRGDWRARLVKAALHL
jgi:hypothetical protein